MLHDPPNVLKTVVQDIMTQAGNESVANDKHRVILPTKNKRCVSGDEVTTVYVVDERTLESKMTDGERGCGLTVKLLPTCTRSGKLLNVRKRLLVLAGAKNRWFLRRRLDVATGHRYVLSQAAWETNQ